MAVPAQSQPTATFIRPDDRATILDACEAIREACNRLQKRPEKNKKKKAA